VWDESVRAATQQAFHATGRSYADETFTHVAGALDATEAAWVKMYRESCEATVVRHEQSVELQDRRTRCLDERLDAATSLTAVFTRAPDPDVLDHALESIPNLDASGCADREALAAEVPPPADPDLRRTVDDLRHRITDAHVLDQAGKLKDARTAIDPLVDAARATGYPEILAQALSVASDVDRDLSDYPAAEAALREDLTAAATAHDDEELAWAAVALTYNLQQEGAYDAALALRPVVEAAIIRAGGDRALRTIFVRGLAQALVWRGHSDEALRLLDVALADERAPGGSRAREGGILEDYGAVLARRADPDGALERFHQARDLVTAELGKDHPDVVGIDINIANQLAAKGSYDEATALYRSVLAFYETNLGPDHIEVAHTLTDLATVLYDQDRLDEAIALLRRALAIKEKALGPTHPDLTSTLDTLANCLGNSGRAAEALPLNNRAIAIDEQMLGNDSSILAHEVSERAKTYEQLDRLDDAAADFRRAIGILERAQDANPVDEMQTLAGYGELLTITHAPDACAPYRQAIAIGDPDYATRPEFVSVVDGLGVCEADDPATRADALAQLERALELARATNLAGLVARTQFDLAQGLALGAPTPTQRRRALDLANTARAYFVSAGAAGVEDLKLLDGFLARIR
jgi:serine/threonine-protein kinase